MKKELDFRVPFTAFSELNAISCFSSLYMYLEDIHGRTDYVCAVKQGRPCCGCGNCRVSDRGLLEKFYFVFDLISGRSALRLRWDGSPTAKQELIEADYGTDYTLDCLYGYAGYDYTKLTDSDGFAAAIKAAINDGKPALARLREGGFRLITGYDGEELICPDYDEAQKKPDKAPAYADLAALYINGEKTGQRFTFKDGLTRAAEVLEASLNEGLWDEYCRFMGWYNRGGLSSASKDERKTRMARVCETMWYTFNCHNFAEVFRYQSVEELKRPEIAALCGNIGPSYGYTHDLAWALIGLGERLDWDKDHLACGYGELVELTLSQIKNNDAAVLASLKSIIAAL